MKLIACIDDLNGMCFNGRRQSRDRAVVSYISKIVGNRPLWTAPSSVSLFDNRDLTIKAADDFLEKAGTDDFCFAETNDVTQYINACRMVYLFRWNREYPADLYFPAECLQEEFQQLECVEFQGFSHPQLTLEVYAR